MTSTGTGHAALDAIVARTRCLLLDFDGPVCSVFSGLPAPRAAAQLRRLFPGDQLPGDVKNTPDPIEVFTYAATISPELALLGGLLQRRTAAKGRPGLNHGRWSATACL